MTERLKQIWSGFEETTTRHLTGSGVDNIEAPRRINELVEDGQFLPQEFEGPATAAFDALRETLAAQEKKFSPLGSSKNETPRFGETAEDDLTAPASFNDDEVFMGLRATALRTERADYDYQSFMESDEGRRSVKRYKKKKRFGLF